MLVLNAQERGCPWVFDYRGTSLIRKRSPLGPYSRSMPLEGPMVALGVRFLMSEVPLYRCVFLYSSPSYTTQQCVRESQILVAHPPPQGVLASWSCWSGNQ